MKREEGIWVETIMENRIVEKFSKTNEKYQVTKSRSLSNPKQNKQTTTQQQQKTNYITIKLLKT